MDDLLPMAMDEQPRRVHDRNEGYLLQSEAEWRRKCIESNQQFEAAYRFWCARTNYVVQDYRA